MENQKITESIRVVAQGIADTAAQIDYDASDNTVDMLIADIQAKFDLLESLMLEI